MFELLSGYSIQDLSRAYISGKFTPIDVLEFCFQNIEKTEGEINAYVNVFYDSALESAIQAKKEISRGLIKSSLHGIPVSVKDLCDISGIPTTASSKVLESNIPLEDSWIIKQLKKSGAIIIGKTHTHEFAYGAKTPQTSNPLDRNKIIGGSSGGSAASILTDTAWASIGTDTAGSVRIPASLSGLVGFKPTYNVLDRKGIIPLSSSLDHVGLLSKTVSDCQVSFDSISNNDVFSSHSKGANKKPIPIKIGLPKNYYFENICEDTRKTIEKSIKKIDYEIREVSIPLIKETIIAKTVLMMSEASAYHSDMLQNSPNLYTDEVRQHLINGLDISAVDYIKAKKLIELIKEEINLVFEDIDVLLCPTVPRVAVNRDEEKIIWSDNLTETINQCYTRFTILANVTGRPAITLPVKNTRGLPVGLQLIGQSFQDKKLLEIAAHLERCLSG